MELSLRLVVCAVITTVFTTASSADEARESFQFPCEASSFGEGRLIFQGDVHEGSPLYDANRVELDRRAGANEIYLAKEGEFMGSDVPGENVFGYDDPVTHSLTALVNLDNYIILAMRRGQSTANRRLAFFNNLRKNPVMRDALSRSSNLPSGSTARELQDRLRALAEDPDPEAGRRFILSDINRDNDLALRVVFRSIAMRVARDAKKIRNRRKWGTPDSIDLIRPYFYEDTTAAEVTAEIGIKWRNRRIIKNIMELFCNRPDKDKDLVVVMGRDHFEDMEALFEGVDSKPEIRFVDVGTDFERVLSPSQPKIVNEPLLGGGAGNCGGGAGVILGPSGQTEIGEQPIPRSAFGF